MTANSIFAIAGTWAFSIILGHWSYTQNKIAHLWHCFGSEQHAPPRPGFDGIVMKDPSNSKIIVDFPESWRANRARATFATSAGMFVVLLLTVVAIFTYKASLKDRGASTFELLIPAILNAIQVAIYGGIYKKVAAILTDFENHRTVLEHNSELFKKLTFFYAVNNYATLIYIAFLKRGVEGCYDAVTQSEVCGVELSIQVATVFIFNDFLSRLAKSAVVPELKRLYKAHVLKGNSSLVLDSMGPCEQQFYLLAKYDPTVELVQDYIELYVQWGFLTMFGSAFPLVVFFAFITNFLETRTDGYKLLHNFRRVVPHRVGGIGEPLAIFNWTLFVSVPVNAGLVVYSYGSFSGVDESLHVWIFIAHFAFSYFCQRNIYSI